MAESKDDVADQLIAMGYSEEDVSTSQSKALNPSNINEVHDLVRAELKVKSHSIPCSFVHAEYTSLFPF